MDGISTAIGGVFLVCRLISMIGMIVGWIILLVAIWRRMKALESAAASLFRMSQKQEQVYFGLAHPISRAFEERWRRRGLCQPTGCSA